MKDRVSAKPNRYAVYDDAHNFIRYEYHERADEPTQVGDALNKATLLGDGTCTALGIPATSVPDDAFAKLAVGAGKYGYYLTVKFADGSPAVGITVSGLTSVAGGSCVIDGNGNALGLSTSARPSINISGYLDINTYSATLTSTGIITFVAITLTVASPDATIITSQSFKFSRDVLVDVHAVGGGYNGSGGYGGIEAPANEAVGGADGYQHFRLNIPISKNVTQTAQIGAANGGNTSFAGVYSSHGSNNAGGTYAQNGRDATVKKFGTGSVVAGGSGGGGGGGRGGSGNHTSGGSPFGGGGGYGGSGASGYGGGGGGGVGYEGGKGYQGVLFLRWRYA